MGRLSDTVVLVTGGGSGLGRAIVRRFLAEGAMVSVLELMPEKAASLKEELGLDVVVEGDATTSEGNERAVAATCERYGRLDTFIGNAALWDFGRSLEDMPVGAIAPAFEEIFSLNVKAYMLGVKAALSALRASRGRIILTLSNAAFYPGGGGPLYVASKHAVVGLVRQLAYELSPYVRVNGVAPGGMRTDLRGPTALGLADTAIASIPIDEAMQRGGPLGIRIRPEDYTGHYVLLADPEDGRAVTGSVHICDGGIGVRGRREAERLRAELA